MKIESRTKNRFQSIKVTLAVAFLLLNLVVLLIAISLETIYNFHAQQKVIATQQQLIAQDAANKVKTFIQEKFRVLETTAKFGSINGTKEEQKLTLDKLLGIEPIFREGTLLDIKNQELVKASRLSTALTNQLTEQISNDIYLKVSQGKTYISSVYIDKITSEPMIIMAVSITDVFGDFKGILRVEVNLKFMWDLLEGIKIGKNGLAYVVDRQGDLIAYSDIGRVLKGENLARLKQVAEFVNGDNQIIKGDAEISQGIRNSRVVANYMPLGTPDWAVITEIPVLEAYESIIRMIILSVGIILMSIVLAIVVGIYLAKKITKPIIKLRDAANQIGEGNLETKIVINTKDEIGELADTFNRMTMELKKSKDSIEEYNNTLEQEVEKRTIDLKLSEKRFKDITFSSADWIWEIDKNGVYTYCSEKIEDILEYKREEIIGKTPFDLMPAEEVVKISSLLSTIFKEKRPIKNLENWNLSKTGKLVCLLTDGVPIIDDQGNLVGYRGIDRDITEHKRSEKFRFEKESAEAANRAKSEFLSHISHELRTPMNAIIGFSELLVTSVEDEDQRSQIEMILDSGKSLLKIINDILDLSKIEAGEFKIEYSAVNIQNITKDVEKIFSNKFKEKGILFIIEIGIDVPAILLLDEVRIRQILINLIGNALKFTSKGHIKLLLNVTEQKASNRIDLLMSIEDTGIGIPEEQQELIFQAFKQQQNQSTKLYGGTGLGLTITKRLVEMMRGKIGVSSTLGQGSTFTIVFSDIKIPEQKITFKNKIVFNPKSTQFEKAKILICDDNLINRKLVVNVLKHSPLDFYEAENGKIAIDLATQIHPDLILMDLIMPEMNGYDSARTIKEHIDTKNIPIIALSATVLKDEELESYKSIFNDYLIKPLNLSDLYESIKKYLKFKSIALPDEATEVSHISFEFTEAQKKQLPSLMQTLEKQFLPLFNEILANPIIDRIEDFGKQLTLLGNKQSIETIAQYGNKIVELAKKFDVEKLFETLGKFPMIVEEIKSINKKVSLLK